MSVPAFRPSWDSRLTAWADRRTDVDVDDWVTALTSDPRVLGAIMRDCILVNQPPHGRGARPVPTPEEGLRRWQLLVGDEFSTEPFAVALTGLLETPGVTLRYVESASRDHDPAGIGLSRTKVNNLARGATEPSPADIELISAVFNRSPLWFADYRVLVIVRAVHDALVDQPDRTAAIVSRIPSS